MDSCAGGKAKGVTNSTDEIIIEGTHYHSEAKPGYVPFPYPHPLVQIETDLSSR